jgi:hypothetical protein
MKPCVSAIADALQHTADPHALIRLAALATCLSIGLTGCGSSIFDRADGQKFFHGIIIDQEGRPVPDAEVSLFAVIPGMWGNAGGADEVSTRSDRNGSFALPGMDRPYGNIFPDVSARAPGYVIDNFAFQQSRSEFDKHWPYGNHAQPHIVRAWKFGERRLNRNIYIPHTLTEDFPIGDTKELYVKIVLHAEPIDELGNPREHPELVSATEHEDWDVALSLMSDAPDAGNAPFTKEWMRKTPPGVAIRVRARIGGVCQADPIFPFSAKNKAFSPVIALKWPGLVQYDSRACFRVFYRNPKLGYMSFLTVDYQNGSVSGQKHCSLSFTSAHGQTVPYAGILNPSGDDCLEYDPEFAHKMDGHHWSHRVGSPTEMEVELKELRRHYPSQALEIEKRMRAEGKEVPPR